MATIQSTLKLQDQMSGTLKSITTAMRSTLDAMRTIKGVELGPEFAKAAGDIAVAENNLESFSADLAKVGAGAKNAGDGFTIFKGLATNALTSVANYAKDALLGVVSLSDQITTQSAKLGMINDGLQTQAQLQESIYQAAQRSRTAYFDTADAVAKIALQAPETFKSTQEAVVYAELLGKAFKIAGTDAASQAGATRQLVQALGAGALRGDELNSVFEAAPNLIRNISEYLEVPISSIRKLAEEGKLTADIVKNSMFAASDAINEQFAQMPMTWAQLQTTVSNFLVKTLTPVLQTLGSGASWVISNWEAIAPVFVGLAAGITAAGIAWGVYTVAQMAANGTILLAIVSLQTLYATLLANPLFWIALVIGVIVGAIYKWIQSVGGIEIAWKMVVDGVLSMVGNMKVGVLTGLETMINGAINMLNGFIEKLNQIPGVNLQLINAVSLGAKEEAAKVAAESAFRKFEIGALQTQKALQAGSTGIGTMGGGVSADPMAKYTSTGAGGTALKTRNVEPLITEENLKMLHDISTMGYQLHYQQITPQVTMSFGDIRETADADAIIQKFADQITEVASTRLDVTYGS